MYMIPTLPAGKILANMYAILIGIGRENSIVVSAQDIYKKQDTPDKKGRMRKILILSLPLFFVPVSGQAFTSEYDRFHMNVIRAQGWKCDEIRSRDRGQTISGRSQATEVVCKNGKTYYFIWAPVSSEKYSASVCHKGICKKFNRIRSN